MCKDSVTLYSFIYEKSYCGKSFEQLDCEAWQRWVMFVVNILGQDNYEVVAMATMLRQRLLQRGHDIRWRLQADDVVCDGKGQFDSLDQDLTGTLRTTAGKGENKYYSTISLIMGCTV